MLGCSGGELGELELNAVQLGVTAYTSQPEIAAVGASAGGLVITQAFVSASGLALSACREGVAALALPARGYDLLAVPPPSELITTAVSEYCELRLDLDPVEYNARGDVPPGACLFVAGALADGTPFTIESSESVGLRLTTEPGTHFGEEPLLLGFDLGVWLAEVNPPSPRAPIRLTMRTESAVKLFVDTNGDQLLGPDEAESAVAVTR
jgi:hypothetical protein